MSTRKLIYNTIYNRQYRRKYKGLDICIDKCKYNSIVPCKDRSIEPCIGDKNAKRDAATLCYEHRHYEVEYAHPSQYAYACQHIFDTSKRALIQYGVSSMKDYFRDLIDYSTCKEDLEIIVLTRAGLWLRNQE